MSLEQQIKAYKEANPKKYPEQLYESFTKYWLPNWEKQPKWKLAGRLSTWARHNKKYAQQHIIDTFKYHLQRKQNG